MLLKSCQLYNRGRSPPRGRGPDLSVPHPPDARPRSGPTLSTIDYGPQWAANCDRELFLKVLRLGYVLQTSGSMLSVNPNLTIAQDAFRTRLAQAPKLRCWLHQRACQS